MEVEISMRMQRITFLQCMTLDHSLIMQARGLHSVGGGEGVAVRLGNGADF